ncbi:MAG: XrtA-associated tyrosine autokinase [Azoarcus sp.]|jgi:receptor protein-tyrosine kinase|nr:XrtA-associated tyrosine autokinase [Azoarcus sp.]
MSLIEKAVARLDTLKRAAGDIADAAQGSPFSAAAAPQRREAATPKTEVQISREVEIDIKRLIQRGMVTPNLPRSRIAEEFRLIKRPLLKNVAATGAAAVENGNLIMVTSSLPGEGKSFTAINLAISMAMELDYRVLLVDADVARPSVLNRLGLEPERGLLDVLAGDVEDLSEVMLRTNIDKLTLLPAGMPHARATEMLASDTMTHLLVEMVTRYPDRVIVFDSPPLLVTTEARVLATHMGQIVLVVEAEETTHGTVKQALATIETCPIKMAVLNKSRQAASGSYGYGYRYGYGYGRDKGKSRQSASKPRPEEQKNAQ